MKSESGNSVNGAQSYGKHADVELLESSTNDNRLNDSDGESKITDRHNARLFLIEDGDSMVDTANKNLYPVEKKQLMHALKWVEEITKDIAFQ